MTTRIMAQSDGSQFLIHGDGDIDGLSVVITGEDAPTPVTDMQMTQKEAEDLAQKLTTHTAEFDTMTGKYQLLKLKRKAG